MERSAKVPKGNFPFFYILDRAEKNHNPFAH